MAMQTKPMATLSAASQISNQSLLINAPRNSPLACAPPDGMGGLLGFIILIYEKYTKTIWLSSCKGNTCKPTLAANEKHAWVV